MKFILKTFLFFPIIGFGQSQAFIYGNDTICDNENIDAEIVVSFTGVAPATFVYEVNGIAQSPITTTINPYIIPTQQAGYYTLLSYSDANGTGLVSGQAIVTINSAPIAMGIANPDSLSVLYPTTTFYDQSIGNIVSWEWSFGDNTANDDTQNPTHKFPQWPPTVHQVFLIVIDDNGCSDTTSITVTVGHPTTSIEEQTTKKEILKVTDLLGRETKVTNQPLFYIYDDGTVEKRIVIE
jgi:PKD repeat protein